MNLISVLFLFFFITQSNASSNVSPSKEKNITNQTLYSNDTISLYLNSNVKINLLYFNKQNDGPRLLENMNLAKFQEFGFDFAKDTIFIIHGLKAWGIEKLYKAKDDILLKRDVNIVLVDWKSIAQDFYFIVRYRISKVSDEIANFINILIDNNYSANNIHMIGFSLGCHIAGLTGKLVNRGKIASIIAVDPPSLLFSYQKTQNRLAVSDAQVVEVLHGSILTYTEPIGHVDFYVNGATHQPGCAVELGFCSHLKVLDMYVESISSLRGFVGMKCLDIIPVKENNCLDTSAQMKMGEIYPKQWVSGLYWIKTANSPPYAEI